MESRPQSSRTLSGDTLYDANDNNENTPLLKNKPSKALYGEETTVKKTPLPVLQIGIVLLLQLCEPITSQSVYPYINQLVGELDITGGNERKIGYYVGLIESLFYAVEALTVLQWSRISDHVGRKPVLLIGVAGTIASMLAFGFSTTFTGLVISRCVAGLLNGNIGVMKSAMGDLTDVTNRAQGFALLPVTWAVGSTFGALLGGVLARPQDQWPNAFPGKFWATYPYLLPCIATSGVVVVIFVIALVLFKESNPRKQVRSRTSSEVTLCDFEEPIPLQKLLRYPSVFLTITNYTALAFVETSFIALFPLFCAMPISIGGLGFTPSRIGYIMGSYGVFTGIFQFLFFARITAWIGEKRIYTNGLLGMLLLFVLMPGMNWLAKSEVSQMWLWLLMSLVIVTWTAMDMAFGAIFIYVTSCAPNRTSLGAVNGLAQTSVSISRAIGPAMATTLFSLSAEYQNVLGGYAVFAFFGVLTVGSLVLAQWLPDRLWDVKEEED